MMSWLPFMSLMVLMAPKKAKATTGDDLQEVAPKTKGKSPAKAKAKPQPAGKPPCSLHEPLPVKPVKRLWSKIDYALKNGDADKKSEALAAKQAYDEASQEDKFYILSQLAENSNLKYIPAFVRSKREAVEGRSKGVDDWMDKHRINTYLHYPTEQLDAYVEKLESRDHKDEISKGLGLKEYKFTWQGSKETDTIETEARELSASTHRLTTKQVDAIHDGTADSSGAKKETAVKVLASKEYLSAQSQAKLCLSDLKKLQAQQQECSVLLSTLRAAGKAGNEAAERAHIDYREDFQNIGKLIAEVIDEVGCAKALAATDTEQSEEMVKSLTELRSKMFTLNEGIKDAKPKCKQALDSAMKPKSKQEEAAEDAD